MTNPRSRFDVLDLTLDQVEVVEAKVGAPFQDWGTVSRIGLARAILDVRGELGADGGGMTVRELQDSILVDGDEAPNP